MEVYLYIGLAIAGLALIIYPVVTEERRRRAKILTKIQDAWGKIPDRTYEYQDLVKISRYYEVTKKKEFCIDDITWNDLEMDRLFMAVNNTVCSTGEEYLYKMLRIPCFEQKTLDERNRVANYFASNPDVRLEYQVQLGRVGYAKNLSLIDYITEFAKLKQESSFPHFCSILLVLVAAFIVFLSPAIGVLLVIGAMAFNIITYYKDKAKIEPYLISVGIIVHIIQCCQELQKRKEPELEQYLKEMGNAAKELKSIQTSARWLSSGDSSGGDITQVFFDYIRMLTHMDLIKFNSVLGKVQAELPAIERILEVIGMLDASIAIASYRESLPFFCRGELEIGSEHRVEGKDLYHPMLKEPVANSLYESRPVLLTGSNASGKSTFLKTVAISAIMAQTIDTVPAHSYKGTFCRIYSSMALKDNLQGQESYYIVEIKSLKRIIDAAGDSRVPICCFVDEVLRGTNTVERIAASSRILQHLAEQNVMCFAATHDIELTHMLTDYYENYHFTEEVKDDDVSFSYKLHKGRATTRNAIKLLQIMGYGKDVIEQADQTAKRFLDTGVWSL